MLHTHLNFIIIFNKTEYHWCLHASAYPVSRVSPIQGIQTPQIGEVWFGVLSTYLFLSSFDFPFDVKIVGLSLISDENTPPTHIVFFFAFFTQKKN